MDMLMKVDTTCEHFVNILNNCLHGTIFHCGNMNNGSELTLVFCKSQE